MADEPETYVHGHHASVLRSHRVRTVENSAPHLIAHLEAGQRVLDIGCGPGSITAGIARRVEPGPVLGIDASTTVVADATAEFGSVAAFEVGDVYALDATDDSFDIVHAHQVLQHLDRPVDALVEMRRVTRPGGVIAVRDADYGAMSWAPANDGMTRWMALYQEMTAARGHDANAGRHLLAWAQAAGLTDIEVTSSNWTYADATSRAWWADLWADRVLQSSYRSVATGEGLATDADLQEISTAWKSWAEQPDGFFMCPSVEIVARP